MNPFYVGIPAWLGLSIASYLVNGHVLRRLTAEQVGKLALAQRSEKLKTLFASLALLAIFMAARYSIPSHQDTWFLIALGLLIALAAYSEYRTWRIASKLLPMTEGRIHTFGRILALLGVTSLLVAMAFTVF
jgi:hypothetical protein